MGHTEIKKGEFDARRIYVSVKCDVCKKESTEVMRNQVVVDLARELWGIEISDITLERIN